MKSVYMICGIGNSGKSTYANKLYKELKDKDLNKKIIICSVDEQRPRGTNIPIEVARERFVKKVKDNIDFYDILIADFSFDVPSSRKWFLDEVNFDYDIDFNCIYLNPPYEKIISNYYKRDRKFILTEENQYKISQLCSHRTFPTKDEFNFCSVNIEIITDFNI